VLIFFHSELPRIGNTGIIETEDIMVMTQAIKEGCEQVDIDEW